MGTVATWNDIEHHPAPNWAGRMKQKLLASSLLSLEVKWKTPLPNQRDVKLDDLTGILVCDPERLKDHQIRIDYNFNMTNTYQVLLVAIMAATTGFVWNGNYHDNDFIMPLHLGNLYKLIYKLVFLVIIILVIALLRYVVVLISAIILTGFFADSLCVLLATNVLLLLSRNDAISDSDRRRQLLRYLHELQKGVLLLPAFYGRDDINREWLIRHFRRLGTFIAERRRWVITPCPTTLADLRTDFASLLPILVQRDYGSFKWPAAEELPQPPKGNWAATAVKVAGGLGTFAVLVYLSIERTTLEAVGLDPKLFGLISAAWGLLLVDTALRIGVVSGVVNLVKELKNLK